MVRPFHFASSDSDHLAQVRFILDTWATGELNKGLLFSDELYKQHFKMHLKILQTWDDTDKHFSLKVRKRIFARAMYVYSITVLL